MAYCINYISLGNIECSTTQKILSWNCCGGTTPWGNCSTPEYWKIYRNGVYVTDTDYSQQDGDCTHGVVVAATEGVSYTWKIESYRFASPGGIIFLESNSATLTTPYALKPPVPTITWDNESLSTNVVLNWTFNCESSINTFSIQKYNYATSTWVDFENGISKTLRTYTAGGNTLFTTVQYRVVANADTGNYPSNGVAIDLYYLQPANIIAGSVTEDYPTLTFTATTTNYDENATGVNWYVDGELDGSTTGTTYTGVLPDYYNHHTIYAKYKRDSFLGESNNSVSIKFDTAFIVSGFTSNDTMVIPSGFTHMNYLLVAGGGAGGDATSYRNCAGGGGGAGGVLIGTIWNPVAGSYSVVIGAGGAGSTDGGDSTFYGLTAKGGGNGGDGIGGALNAHDGGSGGGGGYDSNQIVIKYGLAGSGTTGQGHNGYNITGGSIGGGGGAGAAATNVNGGIGYTTSITGGTYTFSKGGNGGNAGINSNGAAGVKYGDGGSGASKGSTGDYSKVGGAGKQGYIFIKLHNDIDNPINSPSGLTSTPTCTGATLSWINNNNVSGVTGNRIQHYYDGNWITDIDISSDSTSYLVTGLTPNMSYTYRVAAYNYNYNAYSTSVEFSTLDPTPFNLDVTKNGLSAIFTWEINDPAYGTQIVPEIRQLTEENWTSGTTLAKNASGYTFTGLLWNTQYVVRIVRYGSEYPSEEYEFWIANPDAPVLSGNTVSTTVDLVWTDPDSANEHYEIYRSQNCFPKIANLLAYYDCQSPPGSHYTNDIILANPDYLYLYNVSNDNYYYSDGKIDYGYGFKYFNQGARITASLTQSGGAGQFERDEDFTIAMWVKPDFHSNGRIHYLFSNVSDDRGYSAWFEYSSDNNTDFTGRMYFRIQVDASTYIQAVTPVLDLSSNSTWSHFVFTYDGSSQANGLKIYCNGNEISTRTGSDLTSTILDGTDNILYIGKAHVLPASPPPPAYVWYGMIDEIAIWDIDISADDVLKIYNENTGLQYDASTEFSLLTTIDYPLQSFTDTGLTAGCQYCYKTRIVVDSQSPTVYSNYSNEECFVIVQLAAPTGLTITDILPDSCTINWVNVETGYTGNYIQMYSGSSFITIGTVASGVTGFNITGLTPNTLYYFRVVVYVDTNQTSSASVSTTTADPTPYALSASTIEYSSNLNTIWTLPFSGYGTGIRAEHRVSGTTAWVVNANLSASASTYTYSGLSFNTEYEIRVVLFDEYTEYPSNTYGIKTPEIMIPTLITRAISGETYTSASTGGIITNSGNAVITSRGVCYSTSINPDLDNNKTIDGSGATTWTSLIQNLVPNTFYHVRAYATNIAGTGYGQDLFFTTSSVISDTYIRFQDNVLYDMEVKDFEINFALADIVNPAQAKTSYTIPIKIPYSKKASEIFGTLFNVNNLSSITDEKVDAKLIYKNKVIINGYCYVDSFDFDYINIIIARADLSLFEDIKDSKLSDLVFSGTGYTYNNKTFREYWNDNLYFTYSGDTADYHFVTIDWKGDIYKNILPGRGVENMTFGETTYNNFSPVIRVKTVFDKVFEQNGYTYSASTEILDKLDGMFMTSNANANRYTCNGDSIWAFGGIWTDTYNDNKYLICKEIAGVTKSMNIPSTRNSTYNPTYYPCTGFYPFLIKDKKVELVVKLKARKYTTSTANTKIKLFLQKAIVVPDNTTYSLTQDDEIQLCEISAESTGFENYEATYTYTPKASDIYGGMGKWINKTNDVESNGIYYGGYVLRIETESNAVVEDNVVKIYGRTENWLFYTGNTFTLTDLLSESYTQYNFINDILNMFDCYLYADATNKNHLNILTHAEFNTNDVLDWSNKFTTTKLKITDTSKELNSKYIFSFADSDDKINKSYKTLYFKNLNEVDLYNNNELAIPQDNPLKLTAVNPVFTTSKIYRNPNIRIGEIEKTVDYYDGIACINAEENGKICFGYIYQQSKYYNLTPFYNCDYTLYYSPIGLNHDITTTITCPMHLRVDFYLYLTISPYKFTGETSTGYTHQNFLKIGDANTFALQFNSQETLLYDYTGSTITNNNLYNNFYADDIESKLYSQQKFLECKMRLNENDVKIENFRKRIWIDNTKLGGAYYRLNKIVFSSDEEELADVELITDTNYRHDYSGLTPAIIYNYDAANNLVYVVKDNTIIVTGDTGVTTSTQVHLYLIGDVVAVNANEGTTSGQVISLNIAYVVNAYCYVLVEGQYLDATTTLEMSTNGGISWSTVDSAVAAVPPGTGDGEIINDTLVLTGLTVTDIQDLRFRGSWDYETGSQYRSGAYTVSLISASTDIGTVQVASPTTANAQGGTTTPWLSS